MRTLLTVVVAAVLVSCSSSSTSSGSNGGAIAVVAAESFWGSIAAQLGGEKVQVTSIVTSPDTDPHDYEPTAKDGRAVASAQLVIMNGLGYDTWVRQSVDANPATNRRVLDVGALLHLSDGVNPHRWYFPDDVARVIAEITSLYKAIAPGDAAYFDEQLQNYETSLGEYRTLLDEIRRAHSGTPVGASESIFEGIAIATGLDLKTPAGFINAISEGTEPTARDKATVEQQIRQRQIEVFVYNSQNASPDVTALADLARRSNVAVATMTETPPENVSFQDWQELQLRALLAALVSAPSPSG